MPKLANERHERFAQELAQGSSKLAAYRKAGYKPDRGAASNLSSNVSISQRVEELREKSRARAVITLDFLTEKLEEARALAIKRGMPSAAIMAIISMAKLHGFAGSNGNGHNEPLVELPPPPKRTNREVARLIAFALAIGKREMIDVTPRTS